MKGWRCGLCAFLVLFAVVSPAQAEDARGEAENAENAESITARLEWRPSEAACLDQSSLAAAVNARWGRPVFIDQGSADLVLSGVVGRSEQGFAATIELKREGGESLGSRRLETKAKNCRALDDSIALAVGLMLDVSRARVVEERREQKAAREAAAGAPGKQAGQRPPATPEPVFAGPSIAVPEERSSSRPFTFEPWVGGEFAFGLLPAVALGGRAGVSLAPGGIVRVDVGASWFLPVDEHADDARGVRLSAMAMDAGLCVDEWEGDAFRLHGCVIQRIGQVRATGLGLSEPATAGELLFDLGIRQVGTLWLARYWALRMGASLEVPLVRYRFVFDDIDQGPQVAYEMNRLSAALELGIALRLP